MAWVGFDVFGTGDEVRVVADAVTAIVPFYGDETPTAYSRIHQFTDDAAVTVLGSPATTFAAFSGATGPMGTLTLAPFSGGGTVYCSKSLTQGLFDFPDPDGGSADYVRVVLADGNEIVVTGTLASVTTALSAS